MSMRGGSLAVLLALLAVASPADARTLHRPPAAKVRPRAFTSCAGLVGYARRHLAATHGVPDPHVVAVGAPPAAAVPVNGSAAPAPQAATPTSGAAETPAFSTTNNQEDGVDEPDLAKTDGKTIFALAQGRLFSIAVGPDGPRLAGSLDVGAGYGAQLLLHGSRLIVISAPSVALPMPEPARPGVGAPGPVILPAESFAQKTTVTEVDVHDPAAMKVARSLTFDGTYVDARQNGSTARVVISSPPRAVGEPAAATTVKGWVPARRFRSSITGRRYVRRAAPCDTIRHPVEFSGLGMVTIVTIDLDRGLWAADSDALMADAQIVYGSTSSLYIATQKWLDPQTAAEQLPRDVTTVIHRFDVSDPDRTTFVASGEVPGYLLNQFSLSEFAGHLRVATTSRPVWWAGGDVPVSQSSVTVLDTRGAVLAPVGQVSGLGQGQQVFSVRFLGDVGYVVTFRRVDPLYTIDLSSPTAPRVAGQLEIEGFSSYLHPVGKGLLLGIGRTAGAEGSGTQLELFDVSDAAAPKLLQKATVGNGSSSEVEYDHHAFLFWPATKLAMLPVQFFSGSDPFVGAIGYRVDRSGITEAGRVAHDETDGYLQPIRRAIVVGDRLFTISDAGVMSSDLTTLARQAFVRFNSG